MKADKTLNSKKYIQMPFPFPFLVVEIARKFCPESRNGSNIGLIAASLANQSNAVSF